MKCEPIQSLACEDPCKEKKCDGYGMGWGVGAAILWFIVIVVIVWFLLWVFKPVCLQLVGVDGRPTGQVDAGRVLVAAIVIAIIILVIAWLIRVAARY